MTQSRSAVRCQMKPRFFRPLRFAPKRIGYGIGRSLLQHALKVVAAKSGESVLVQGVPNVEKFYLVAGAKQIGTRVSGSVSGRDLPLFEILIRPPVVIA